MPFCYMSTRSAMRCYVNRVQVSGRTKCNNKTNRLMIPCGLPSYPGLYVVLLLFPSVLFHAYEMMYSLFHICLITYCVLIAIATCIRQGLINKHMHTRSPYCRASPRRSRSIAPLLTGMVGRQGWKNNCGMTSRRLFSLQRVLRHCFGCFDLSRRRLTRIAFCSCTLYVYYYSLILCIFSSVFTQAFQKKNLKKKPKKTLSCAADPVHSLFNVLICRSAYSVMSARLRDKVVGDWDVPVSQHKHNILSFVSAA